MIRNSEKLEGLQPLFKQTIIEFAHLLELNYGLDIYITSGYRSPEENKEVGGSPHSAHLKGLAVDIAVNSGRERFYIVEFAIRYGFKRIGIGFKHIHLDMDYTKPFPTIFPDVERV